MNIILLLSSVFLFISFVFSLTRQLQMLQQNSYFPSRYLKWVYPSFMTEITFLCFGFCVYSSLYLGEKYIFCLALSVILLGLRFFLGYNSQKKSIKKLVYTGRIKRFYTVSVIAGAFLIFVGFFGSSTVSQICLIVLNMLCFISPMFVLLIWIITKPLESAVSEWYISDAKRILKENKGLTVIGITGSFGKTTTKFILTRILSEKYNTVCTPESFNTPMGVVRTVRESIKPNTQVFVCEMGAKKKGDIKEICNIVHPKYGIITSVGAQHLDTFKSLQNIFSTKFELANEVKRKGGLTFISADSEEILNRYDKTDKTLVLFGKDEKYRAENIVRNAFGSGFDLVLDGSRITVQTKLLGLHSIYDILAAASLAHQLGVSDTDIKVAVSSLKPTEHRLELKSFYGGSLLIDDAYNSNPVGCLEAVRTLGGFEGMKKTIVTPGLIELGEKEYEANYALGLEAAKYCDIIILVGKNRSKPLEDAIRETDFDRNNLYIVSSFKEAMDVYVPKADKNSICLIENDLPDNYLN